MMSTSTATHLSLSVIRASEVKWDSTLRSRLPNLYVLVELGSESRRTKAIKKSLSPDWNEWFSFERPFADRGVKFIIQLMHDSSHWKDKCVGVVDVEFTDILQRCTSGRVTELRLNAPRASSSTEVVAVLHVHFEAVDAMTGTRRTISAAEQAIEQSEITALEHSTRLAAVVTIESGTDHSAEHTELYKSVGTLVSKLSMFVGAMDALSQIHPYVSFAWQLVSVMYKTIEHQFETDKNVVELVLAMRDAFDFVDHIDTLRDKTQLIETAIIHLLKQTDECCLFIQEYARHKFARRMVMRNVDETIDKFLESFRSIKTSIDSGVVVHIAFVSSRISSKVDVMFLKSQLNPDEMDAYHRSHCLPGTRAKIQDEIVEWASVCTDRNIFWLHGVAGSGKSTVSTTIAEHFRTISRLGAHLFFERGKSDPGSVIRTLAYKLASFDSSVEKHVSLAVEQDNEIARATAMTQFECLLRGPLTLAADSMQGPVIIVLDALDECGSEVTRRSLLESFRGGLPLLPKQFRFLITSRKEPDIESVLSSLTDRVHASELEHNSESCKGDVFRYIDYELRKVFIRKRLPVSDDWQWKMERLAEAADGLFIWASTAVREIDCSSPARKLKELVSQTGALTGLDKLYDSVLRSSGISFDDEASRIRFTQVLGTILLGKTSFSDHTIDAMLDFSDDEPSHLILSCLQPVLVYGPGAPIRFCHASFRDYLLNPVHKGDPWFINLEFQKEFIASRCLAVMKHMLRFNICSVESSYYPNDQIPGLQDRIEKNIPRHLEYACLFWTYHLHEARFSQLLLERLSEFLHERFLYWLEVMSLLGKVSMAGPGLFHVMNWILPQDTDVLACLRDARRTISRFALPVSQSMPHIYISVLPFASMESNFMAHYLKRGLSVVQVEQMGLKLQSPLLKELTGHTSSVNAVAFSPDGTRVASGSEDWTVRIWDAESGRAISELFQGEEYLVQSVAFSPDGVRIVCGCKNNTITIWDVENEQGPILGPLERHTGPINSVAFSPNGTHVVSGSADTTIMVWNIEDRQTASVLFEGHVDEVNSVSFSPDGNRIASGSDDKTIRIWDVESRQTVCGPLEGHTRGIWSVAFSCNGALVASGSEDDTIRIWDTESGQCVSVPFEGHTHPVKSVAFSPDDRTVVSGSDDYTVRIWNVESGQVVSGPFEGHSACVNSVAFSPDGTRVVSGSEDFTLRIWDAESRQAVSGRFEGHDGSVFSVTFSPDGKRIASGSFDETIRIWDVDSGHAVSEPFKGHTSTVLAVAFSLDGRFVASGSLDHTVRVWEAETGRLISGPFEGHESLVWSVSFSPDGTRVVSGSEDRTIQIWDVESGQTLSGPLRAHTRRVNSVAFSPDGRHFASGSDDKTIVLWGIESREIASGPLKEHLGAVLSVAFSPDSSRFVSGSADETILIWDAESGKVLAGPFQGHTDRVRSVAFSPDGARVVSGSEDRTIRVWDAKCGQTMFEVFEGHTSAIMSIAYSPDGRRVVSCSADHTIRMWNVEDPTFEWALHEDGWICSPEGELLLWIPPDIRPTLWRPQNTAVFNCQYSTKLSFTRSAIGDRWQECFVPQ